MVSQDTVRTHVKHIYAKIGIHSRDDLVEIIKMPDESLLPKIWVIRRFPLAQAMTRQIPPRMLPSAR